MSDSKFRPGVMCWVKPGIRQAGLIVEIKRPCTPGEFIYDLEGHKYIIKQFISGRAWVVSAFKPIPMQYTSTGGSLGVKNMKEAAIFETYLVPISDGGLEIIKSLEVTNE